MESLVPHMKWVSTKTLFFAPEAFCPEEDRFETWHLPFFQTTPIPDSPAAVIARMTEESIRPGNIRMMLYWWWVYRESIKTPFTGADQDAVVNYMNDTR